MSKNDFICGSCRRFFSSEKAVRDHVRDTHGKGGNIGIYQRIGTAQGRDFDDSPSMADLAVDAELARSMGLHTDDDWLLP